MREAIIVDGVRTASGKKNGRMKDIRPDDLGGIYYRRSSKRVKRDN